MLVEHCGFGLRPCSRYVVVHLYELNFFFCLVVLHLLCTSENMHSAGFGRNKNILMRMRYFRDCEYGAVANKINPTTALARYIQITVIGLETFLLALNCVCVCATVGWVARLAYHFDRRRLRSGPRVQNYSRTQSRQRPGPARHANSCKYNNICAPA